MRTLLFVAAIVSGGVSLAFAQTSVPNVPLPATRSRPLVPMPGAAQPAAPTQLLNSTEEAIDQQARGQFPTMERSPSLPLGTLQRSWDKPTSANGQVAPGVVHYLWHPDFIMGVRTRDFMVTTVLLPNWERSNEFYVGDPVVFEAKKIRANVIAVRSRNAGADSNLTVLGASGNVYSFYLRSEGWNSTQVTDLTVYVDASRTGDPSEPAGTGAQAAPIGEVSSPSAGEATTASLPGMPDYLRRIVFRPENLKFDMKMYAKQASDAEIAPERVFEDGVFTYFDFGERGDTVARPVVHLLVDDVDTVVNTRTVGPKGSILIAESVGDFTLRNGAKVVCVRLASPRPVAAAVEIGLPEGKER